MLQSLHEEGEREILFTNLRKQHNSTINEVRWLSGCVDGVTLNLSSHVCVYSNDEAA